MRLPSLTSLQFLVLDIIGTEERSGQFIREKLKLTVGGKSLPSFYQMMDRLEISKLVIGRHYRIMVK